MKPYFHLIDTETPGRCDVTPLFAQPAAFAQLIADLAQPFSATPLDYVAGIDALGFILGAALALHLRTGFIPIRKKGKLPGPAFQAEFVDYSGQSKGLELRRGLLKGGDQVLLVDEWIETGAQMQAAIDLVEQAGGRVAGLATINIDDSPVSTRLRQRYPCHAIWHNMQPPPA